MLLKKYLLLLTLTAIISGQLMSQTKNTYLKNWQKVDALEKKGQTKSALQEVKSIYKLALKESNDAQQIKTAMYMIKFRGMIEEDSQEKNIQFVDTLILNAKAPAKNILQSMQADMFWQYVQNNRWKFYDRTDLKDQKSKEIATWSLEKLHAKIAMLYNASLDNKALLQKTTVTGFDPVIIKGENTAGLRPTLFDFLAHRALAYYTTDEKDLIKPAFNFTIDQPEAFATASAFINTKFVSKDTASLQLKAIRLFQELLQFHSKDASAAALLDADLERLAFVYQYAVNSNKIQLYETALRQFEVAHANDPASAQAIFLRAQLYYNRGQQFVAVTKPDHQYEIKRAKELLDSAVQKYPKSEGGINSFSLLQQIKNPFLTLHTEQVNVPGQPFRTLVGYKNAPTVYFRVIKMPATDIKINYKSNEDYWKALAAMKAVKSWELNLPDPKDYQEHSTEIKVDALPVGTYTILASLDSKFSTEKNILSQQLIYVSNISYISSNNDDYYVLNRENGQPLINTKVQVWETKYNTAKSINETTKGEVYTTDNNGYFKLKKNKEYRNFTIQFKTADDELFINESNYNNYYNSYETPDKPTTFLFTDRSIYRPGQTVYFKGIVLQKRKPAGESSILSSFRSTVLLKDANDQRIGKLSLVTNDYGSYHGSFKLPEGTLNGYFNLYDSVTNSYASISVEEYKRPKFSVEVKAPIGTFRVGDTVSVNGNAKAYAGNAIDGANVSYRVVRKVRWPIWWDAGFYGRKIFPPGRSEEVEITNGTVKTDAKGDFRISFNALPDESIDKKDQPVFYYEVNADVTDINGETRSGETSVSVAYQSLQLDINLPNRLSVDSLKNISIKSTNLSGVEEKTNATVIIQALKSPGKIFRERFWDEPDQFLLSREEYYSLFPYDVYKNENEVTHYETGATVFNKQDSTNNTTSFEVGKTSFTPGWYKITVTTKDKYGEDVRAEKYIQLYDNKQQKTDEPITVTLDKKITAPGETVRHNVLTGFDKIWLINNVEKVGDKNKVEVKPVTANQPFSSSESITEADRGNIIVNYVFVKNNRVYNGAEVIEVPWSNKKLDITYSSFRDKLLPGAKEKWTVKITGDKGGKAAAELLVSMYDASLDQYKTHGWHALNIWPTLYNTLLWTQRNFKEVNSQDYNQFEYNNPKEFMKTYDELLSLFESRVYYNGRNDKRKLMRAGLSGAVAGLVVSQTNASPLFESVEIVEDQAIKTKDSLNTAKPKSPSDIQIRKNFNETAFFFPDLKTDADGNVSFEFTIPEALTQWKLMTLAHTKDLASGYSEKTVVTQKPLMVQPNAPRFMREGDHMEFSAKVVNLDDKEVTGTAVLELVDATTNKPVDGWFKNVFPNQYFTVAAGQSALVKFPIEIPFNFNSALMYRIVAKSTNYSDGEEMALPVLTNRTLVTETMPLNLRNVDSKKFSFTKLLNSGSSETLSNQSLTVEYSSNPAWYAVQSLPYLMEFPYECAEQTFNRYYANTLAAYISNSVPKIKTVFEKWKTADTSALLSNLQKNEELKSALLQETPWVMEAKNEQQQKKNIALLFDMVKMGTEAAKSVGKLKEMQSSNGGFVWFNGGPDDRYITQYIISGIGHLKKLNALNNSDNYGLKDIMAMVKKALTYLDQKIKADYDDLVKSKAKLQSNQLNDVAIQYLYMRSFFTETPVAASAQKAFTYYREQSKKYWLNNSKYMQAMIALSLNRTGDAVTPKNILRSLKENAIVNEEFGMYWKEWNTGGYYWYQAPVESQALMVEAFSEIEKNSAVVDDLKTWLLKQKQTQNWRTTKATAEACYALLLGGSNWLSEEKEVTIDLGKTTVKSSDDKTEAGTGYFKQTIAGEKVTPDMGNISVTVKPVTNTGKASTATSWGSVYWQYFEDLDKITPAETPLKLNKQLFIETNSDKGPVLTAVTDGTVLKVGDKIKVRIELKADRNMEYVHMKDMRAACMEPVNVLSGYKWQGGLGYYESTKDASTNFFFNWLPKGTYVFEYPMFVTHTGNFSNGITNIQCMYAPEFSSHSEGVRVTVE